MTRSELVAELATRFPQLQHSDAQLAVNTILDAITNSIKTGGRVEIRGFGSFTLNYRPARLGRNPMTGARVDVPAKWTPSFKAGLELRQKVDFKPPPPSKPDPKASRANPYIA